MREDEFTKPRPDCPHPGLWTATDAQSTECEVSALVAAFIGALQPEYVVETGTFYGNTAKAIGEALHANGHGRLDTIEVDPERAAIAEERCAGLPVRVICGSSLGFEPEQPIGFAWFDSLLNLRVPEFERFRSHMTAGAVIGFHDTGTHLGNLAAGIRSVSGLSTIFLNTPRGVCFAQLT